ncbi:uncharacterized protein PAC_01016 [Phialocephala subalpina]|uniref:Uncharacterized protein n=1 Tax=Phialocephala subalpina TaxID=576137 RepID=A0A1L7WEE6_9HELO|nr:uncharacterized protein PAC_01016 [Phialocephala subalpina]
MTVHIADLLDWPPSPIIYKCVYSDKTAVDSPLRKLVVLLSLTYSEDYPVRQHASDFLHALLINIWKRTADTFAIIDRADTLVHYAEEAHDGGNSESQTFKVHRDDVYTYFPILLTAIKSGFEESRTQTSRFTSLTPRSTQGLLMWLYTEDLKLRQLQPGVEPSWDECKEEDFSLVEL